MLARYTANKRLRDALYLQAFTALKNSAGARAYYDAHRGRGAARPDGAPVYVILDNLSAHNGKKILRWAKNNNVHLCFTPTNASWANPIEAHFGPLRQFRLANSNYPEPRPATSRRRGAEDPVLGACRSLVRWQTVWLAKVVAGRRLAAEDYAANWSDARSSAVVVAYRRAVRRPAPFGGASSRRSAAEILFTGPTARPS